MPIYWKNQYQPEGDVKVSPAQTGGPETPGVLGLPVFSSGSSQDEQDRLCLCEQRFCVCTPEQVAYIDGCIDEGRRCAHCGGPIAEDERFPDSAYCSRECYDAPFL